MHPADIKAALQKHDLSQKEVADSLGVSESSVGRTIKGELTSRKIAMFIATLIKQPLEKLWPGKYI